VKPENKTSCVGLAPHLQQPTEAWLRGFRMTEEKPKQGKPPRRGGRGRKRNPNRRNIKAVPKKPAHKPPSRHLKITIRNIQDSNKYGSAKAILEQLLPKLLEKCVETKATNQFVFDVDRKAVRSLLDEEEKFNEFKAKEQARIEAELKAKQSGNGTNESSEDDKPSDSVDDVVTEEEVKTAEQETAKQDVLDVIIAPKTASSAPTITVRPLYVVPARKTRRRGERSGTLYVLLISPKVDDESVNKSKDQSPVVSPSPTTSSGKASQKTVTSTPSVDYTRQLARCRLLLSNALEALREVAELDSKSQENFSGCIVQESLNLKTWKPPAGRPDRREGTIESTLEFKKWLESTEQQKEVLKSRPKPTPGGGVSGAGGEGVENGETVAALVQHLLAKKEEIKRKKTHRKKKDDSKRKPKNEGTTAESRKKTRRGGRGGVKADSRDAKKSKKKDKPPRVKHPAAAAPTAVLRPPATSS
jgi:hypothetical protein